MANRRDRHIGSSFESFFEEERLREEIERLKQQRDEAITNGQERIAELLEENQNLRNRIDCMAYPEDYR